jgi:hypothetical protein
MAWPLRCTSNPLPRSDDPHAARLIAEDVLSPEAFDDQRTQRSNDVADGAEDKWKSRRQDRRVTVVFGCRIAIT